MKDYYAVLGLDPDASGQSIKLAYRRLASQIHPDRKYQESMEEQVEATARMVEVNEAYHILSNAAEKQKYDERLRKATGRVADQAAAAPAATAHADLRQSGAMRTVRSSGELVPTLVREFTNQIRSDLLNNKHGFGWQEKRLEGFDWALEGGSWRVRYWAALRTFATLDRAAAQKLTNYASVAVAGAHGPLRKNFFVFLVAFHRMNEPEQVMSACRRFVSSNEGAQSLVIFVDAAHRRKMVCGQPAPDARLQELVRRVSGSRA